MPTAQLQASAQALSSGNRALLYLAQTSMQTKNPQILKKILLVYSMSSTEPIPVEKVTTYTALPLGAASSMMLQMSSEL
jgi:hypothetical protein